MTWIEFPDDVKRLKAELPWGENCNDEDIEKWWREYSHCMYANWLVLPDNAGAILDAFVMGKMVGVKQSNERQFLFGEEQ